MRRLALLVAVALALLAAPSANAQAGYDSFFNECRNDITRMNWISKDPIGQPGVAVSMHPHDVYGYIRMTENAKANAVLPFPDNNGDGVSDKPDPGFWVNNGLQVFYPSTTCTGGYNWPENWMPSALVNGERAPKFADPGLRTVASSQLVVQWRAPSNELVLPVPYGASLVVGNPHAASWAEQDTEHVRWACAVLGNTTTQPQACPTGHVMAVVFFPDCWDGATGWSQPSSPGAEYYAAALQAHGPKGWDATAPQPVQYDSFPPNGAKVGINASHFRYSTFAGCPVSHPYRIAQAVFWRKFSDPSTPAPHAALKDPAGLTFTSGGPWTFHFDYHAVYGKSYIVPRTWRCLNNRPVFITIVCNPGFA